MGLAFRVGREPVQFHVAAPTGHVLDNGRCSALLANAVRRVLSEEGHVNAVTWCAVALMGTAPIAVSVWQRRAPQDVRFFMAWGAAHTPALLGIAAALRGSPTIVMWLGVLLTIGLVLSAA